MSVDDNVKVKFQVKVEDKVRRPRLKVPNFLAQVTVTVKVIFCFACAGGVLMGGCGKGGRDIEREKGGWWVCTNWDFTGREVGKCGVVC